MKFLKNLLFIILPYWFVIIYLIKVIKYHNRVYILYLVENSIIFVEYVVSKYLAVTLHWINENWIMTWILLDTVPLYERHTGSYITAKVLGSISYYNIGTRIRTATTDNAANMNLQSKLWFWTCSLCGTCPKSCSLWWHENRY